jgi:hypothetical protein
MEVTSAEKPVRFSTIVQKCGKPTVYLPLRDPSKDPEFMRQAKQNRVMSIKQEPAGKQKDFGVIGFLPEKFITYLLFPKSLKEFANARVVGIKYDVVEEARIESGSPLPKSKGKREPTVPEKAKAKRPPPHRKPEPQPESFTVRIQVTAVSERDVEVKAMNKREAEALAKEQVDEMNFSGAKTTLRVKSIRRID